MGTGVHMPQWYFFMHAILTAAAQLYFAWLSYFYLALALRENVLLVNGSNIKGWWVLVKTFLMCCIHSMLYGACTADCVDLEFGN